MIVDAATKRIVATAFAPGRCHDLKLLERSALRLPAAVEIQADSGYQGLQKAHANTRLPHKCKARRRSAAATARAAAQRRRTRQARAKGRRGAQARCRQQQPRRARPASSNRRPLTAAQKKANRALARTRVEIEHVIRELKVFRLLGERYRGKGRRFELRFNLLAALYNHDLPAG